MSDELRARGFDLPDEIVGLTMFDLIARQAERRPEALAVCASFPSRFAAKPAKAAS